MKRASRAGWSCASSEPLGGALSEGRGGQWLETGGERREREREERGEREERKREEERTTERERERERDCYWLTSCHVADLPHGKLPVPYLKGCCSCSELKPQSFQVSE